MSALNRKIMDRFLTPCEERKLWNTVRSHAGIEAERDYAWMLLLRSTGIRVGVLSRMTVGDARAALSNGHLHVRSEINKGRVSYKIFLGKKAEKALRLLLKVRRSQGQPDVDDDALVISRIGTPMSIRAFQERARHWGEMAGLEGFSPHWFRHTLAMRIMKESTARDPRGVAMAALGHRHINSTAIYTRPDKSTLSQIMQEVG